MKRILKNSTGNNTDGVLNFAPRLDRNTVVTGFKRVIDTIYSQRELTSRILTFLSHYRPKRRGAKPSGNGRDPVGAKPRGRFFFHGARGAGLSVVRGVGRSAATNIRAFGLAVWRIGLLEKGRRYFWLLLVRTLIRYPQQFTNAVRLAIYGYHFRRVAGAIS